MICCYQSHRKLLESSQNTRIHKKEIPDIPRRSITGMGGKVMHAYFGVKIERVWEVIKRDIPNLKPKFEKMLIEEVKD